MITTHRNLHKASLRITLSMRCAAVGGPMAAVCLLYLLCLLATVRAVSSGHPPGGEMLRLVTDMLQRVDPSVRPVTNHSKAVQVTIDVALHTIVGLESTEQSLHSNVWIRLEWRDEALTWDPAEYDGITSLHLPTQQIWVPDIIVYNTIEKAMSLDELKKDFSLTVSPDGTVRWLYPQVLKTSCELMMTYFPADIQDCCLDMSTWAYSGLEVYVRNKSNSADLSNYTPNGEWELLEAPVVPYEAKYSCCPEPYYGVKFHFRMQRMELFYLVNIGLPTCLMLTLSFVAILLPAESESKMSLGITIFLSQVVMVLVITDFMPTQSLATPFLSEFMLVVLCTMTAYMVISVLVMRLYHQSREACHLPKVLRWLCINKVCLAIFFPVRWRQHCAWERHRKALLKGSGPDGVGYDNSTRNVNPAYKGLSLHPSTVLPIRIVGRTRHAATQTEAGGMGDTPGSLGVSCHRDGTGGSDLMRLREWLLLAMMFERFWNTILAAVTLSILVWIGIVTMCMRGQKLAFCVSYSPVMPRMVE